MGKKGKIKCLVCQHEFKKVAGDAQQCPACASLTTAPLRPVVAPDAPSAHEGGGLKRKHSEEANGAGQVEGACEAGVCDSVARARGAEALQHLAERTTVIEAVGPSFYAALAEISTSEFLAVDCEGVLLSRTGPVTLVQVATSSDKYFLFDVKALGAAAFGCGDDATGPSLKAALEDGSKRKYMYDCRVDSDALYHQFGVELKGVYDLQLLSVAIDRHHKKTINLLPSFGKCCRQALGGKTVGNLLALKAKIKDLYDELGEEGGQRMTGESALWDQRPMTVDTIRYAAADVAIQGPLYMGLLEKPFEDEDHKAKLLERVAVASETRLAEYRDLEEAIKQGDPSSKEACTAAPTI